MNNFYLEIPNIKRKEAIIDYINELELYNSEINGIELLAKILDGSKTMIIRGAAGRKIPHSRVFKDETLYFMEKGSIDYQSLDVLEHRFKHYVDEGGNSFIEDLMKDLRKLPNN